MRRVQEEHLPAELRREAEAASSQRVWPSGHVVQAGGHRQSEAAALGEGQPRTLLGRETLSEEIVMESWEKKTWLGAEPTRTFQEVFQILLDKSRRDG